MPTTETRPSTTVPVMRFFLHLARASHWPIHGCECSSRSTCVALKCVASTILSQSAKASAKRSEARNREKWKPNGMRPQQTITPKWPENELLRKFSIFPCSAISFAPVRLGAVSIWFSIFAPFRFEAVFHSIQARLDPKSGAVCGFLRGLGKYLEKKNPPRPGKPAPNSASTLEWLCIHLLFVDSRERHSSSRLSEQGCQESTWCSSAANSSRSGLPKLLSHCTTFSSRSESSSQVTTLILKCPFLLNITERESRSASFLLP